MNNYAIEQIKAAYWATFHKSGEVWFDYLGNDDENEASTDGNWDEFFEKLGPPKQATNTDAKPLIVEPLWRASEIVLDAFKRRIAGYQIDYEMEVSRIENLENVLKDFLPHKKSAIPPDQSARIADIVVKLEEIKRDLKAPLQLEMPFEMAVRSALMRTEEALISIKAGQP